MGEISNLLRGVALPPMWRIRQSFPRPRLDDPLQSLRRELARPGVADAVSPGMRVALTAGSRGIRHIAALTKEVVRFCRERGAEPFIVAAMGGHGGAAEAGQRAVLATYGLTEENMGCPVSTAMEVTAIGRLASGEPVVLGRAAAAADGIIVINRVQAHTTFHGEYESGLIKMMGVGLGNQIGAQACHRHGLARLGEKVREYGLAVHRSAKILFGLAIIENAYGETAEVHALAGAEIPREEPALLERAKSLMPRFYFEAADVLVVDEIGKDISGDGMDPNLTGRYATGGLSGGLAPQRLVVLDLSAGSNHNGNGIGLADITTGRVARKFDREKSYPNVLTTTALIKCRMPLVFDNDREAVQAAVLTCAGLNPGDARLIRLKNTLTMDDMLISEALCPEARAHANIEIVSGPEPWPFDAAGNLWPL